MIIFAQPVLVFRALPWRRRPVRMLNVGCVGISLAMNALAAAPGWRDLAIWVMPAVHVRVEQARPLLASAPQVRRWDAQLVGQALIADLGRDVGAGRHRDAVRPEFRVGSVNHELAMTGSDSARGSDYVDLTGLLIAQHLRFFFNDPAPTQTSTLSLHDAPPPRPVGTTR